MEYYKTFKGDGEMAQGSEHIQHSQRTLVQVPAPTSGSTQLPLTPVTEDPMLSSFRQICTRKHIIKILGNSKEAKVIHAYNCSICKAEAGGLKSQRGVPTKALKT